MARAWLTAPAPDCCVGSSIREVGGHNHLCALEPPEEPAAHVVVNPDGPPTEIAEETNTFRTDEPTAAGYQDFTHLKSVDRPLCDVACAIVRFVTFVAVDSVAIQPLVGLSRVSSLIHPVVDAIPLS